MTQRVPLKRDHLRSLAWICRRFGGRLAIIPQRRFDLLFEGSDPRDPDGVCVSPFTSAHGIHWQKKVVFAVRGREEVGSIIHDMGHVFADAHHPESDGCCEFNWFGWEIALAQRIGAYRTWSRHNVDYIVNAPGGREWGALDERGQRDVAARRLTLAKKIGVVAHDGTPRSIR